MNAKNELLNKIIASLREDYLNWKFDKHTACHKKTGIEIWIANMPILNIKIYNPTTVRFGLISKIKLHKAISYCRSMNLLSKFNLNESI